MNGTQLRKQFDQWAAPLRAAPPPPFETIRRRARIRLGRIVTAAGSAAAVIALAAVLAVTNLGGSTSGPSGPGPFGSGPYPAPPAQPYVYVSFSLGPTAQIRNAETGAVLATLRPPGQSTTFGVAAASPTDRLFVVAENPANGTVTFVAVRITGAGSTPSVRMAPVPHVVLPNGTQISDLVVNQAENRFALESQTPDGKYTLSIYNLVSGSLIGRWPAGSVQLMSPLAFLPNGNLAVVWAIGGPTATKTHVKTNGSAAIDSHTAGASSTPALQLVNRIINPAVPFRAGSTLIADSQPDTALHRRIGTLTSDGNMSLSLVQGPGSDLQFVQSGSDTNPSGGPVSIAEFSSATGALVHLIPIGPATALTAPEYCGVVWASADGRDLLTQCGTRQQEVIDGKVTAVRLAWTFPTSGVTSVSPFAW